MRWNDHRWCLLALAFGCLHSSLAAADPPSGPRASGGDWVEMRVRDVMEPQESGPVIVLTPKGRADGVLVPIYIGENEAMAIRMRLSHRSAPRPLTHDLLESVIHALGATVTEVHIEDLRDNTYIGRVYLAQGGKKVDLDARSSDAIALALGTRAPIYCARRVIDEAGVKPTDKPAPRPEEEGPPALRQRSTKPEGI